jgi:hypothetical protein
MTLRKKSLFYAGRAMIINAALLSVMIVNEKAPSLHRILGKGYLTTSSLPSS